MYISLYNTHCELKQYEFKIINGNKALSAASLNDGIRCFIFLCKKCNCKKELLAWKWKYINVYYTYNIVIKLKTLLEIQNF